MKLNNTHSLTLRKEIPYLVDITFYVGEKVIKSIRFDMNNLFLDQIWPGRSLFWLTFSWIETYNLLLFLFMFSSIYRNPHASFKFDNVLLFHISQLPTFWCLLNQMQETENQKPPSPYPTGAISLKWTFDKARNLTELVLWERSFDDLAAESNTEHKWSLLFIATVYIWVLIQIRETLPQFQNVLKLLNYLFDRIWHLV